MTVLYKTINKSIENNRKFKKIVEQSREILQKTKAETSDQNHPMRIVFDDSIIDDDKIGKFLSDYNQSVAVIR